MAALSSRFPTGYLIYDRILPLEPFERRYVHPTAEIFKRIEKRIEEIVHICKPRGFSLFRRASEPDLSGVRELATRLGVQLFELAESESITVPFALNLDIPSPSELSTLLKISLIPLARGRSKEELNADVTYVSAVRSLIQVLVGKYARRVLNEISEPLITKGLINRSLSALHRYLKDIVPLTEEELSGDLTEAFFKEIVHPGFQKKMALFEMQVREGRDVGSFIESLSTQVLQNIIYFESPDISASIERACTMYSYVQENSELFTAQWDLLPIIREYHSRAIAVAQAVNDELNRRPFVRNEDLPDNERELKEYALSTLMSIRTLHPTSRDAFLEGYLDIVDRVLDISSLASRVDLLLPSFKETMLRVMSHTMSDMLPSRDRYTVARNRINVLKAELVAATGLTPLAGAGFDPARCIVRDVAGKIVDCRVEAPCRIAEMWPSVDLIRERASEEFSQNCRFVSELREIAVMAYSSAECSVSASGAGATPSSAGEDCAAGAAAGAVEAERFRLTSVMHGFSARERFKALLQNRHA